MLSAPPQALFSFVFHQKIYNHIAKDITVLIDDDDPDTVQPTEKKYLHSENAGLVFGVVQING